MQKISENIVNPPAPNVDLGGTTVINSQPGSWWTFFYGGKPRLALVVGNNIHGNLVSLTANGTRTFKPAQMFDIQDVTVLGGTA